MQQLLLVEDDAEGLQRMERAADGEDRCIFKASDFESAIKTINEQTIDVVVTDLALHSAGLDTDGLDVLRAAIAKDPDVPVLVVSNYFTARSTEEALDLGAFDIIDRGASIYAPQDMLRLKIKLALRFRRALKEAR